MAAKTEITVTAEQLEALAAAGAAAGAVAEPPVVATPTGKLTSSIYMVNPYTTPQMVFWPGEAVDYPGEPDGWTAAQINAGLLTWI